MEEDCNGGRRFIRPVMRFRGYDSLDGMLWRMLCVAILMIHLVSNYTDAVCTFPTVIRGNWTSSEKGLLTFTEDTIIDYPMPITVGTRIITFVCDTSNGTQYLLKGQSSFKLFGVDYYAYLCFDLHRVSDYKYWYQVLNEVEAAVAQRVFARPTFMEVDMATGCNRAEPVDDATFNVLVKENAVSEGFAEATCPLSLLHVYSTGSLSSVGGTTTTCTNTSLDVCTDRTAMSHTYGTSCDSSLQFSTAGTFICLYHITNDTSGVTYLHIWNNDTTLASGHVRIICYAFEETDTGFTGTLYPGACLEGQTSSSVISPGISVQYDGITQTCVETQEEQAQLIYYVAIVLGAVAFLLLLGLLIFVTCKTKCRCFKNCCKRCCKRGKVEHSDVDLKEEDVDEFYRKSRTDTVALPGVFVARKPIKLGPIIEPYLEPPAKIDLLYEVEPRPTSSRLMFSRSAFWDQLSLKSVTLDESSRQASRSGRTPAFMSKK